MHCVVHFSVLFVFVFFCCTHMIACGYGLPKNFEKKIYKKMLPYQRMLCYTTIYTILITQYCIYNIHRYKKNHNLFFLTVLRYNICYLQCIKKKYVANVAYITLYVYNT